jgi:demethylmenaquinone methyltransferase / 2-methoxy-6-polyprenyl-1,4-benzoquinol methylase
MSDASRLPTAPSDPALGQIIQSPIPTMTAYYADAKEKGRFIADIFDRTAPDYDRMEKLLGLGSGSWYRGEALLRAGLAARMNVIDVAVGTGLVAREAVRIVGDARLVVGVDPSPGMLENAKVPPGVRLLQGRAEEIPFPDQQFDFLSMGYALRHISDLSAAFREFHRVLKPGARICLLEITPPRSRIGKALLKTYMRGVVPTIGRLFARSGDTAKLWRYYWDTIDACVPPENVMATLAACGFEEVHRVVEHGIFSEYQAVAGT